MIRTDKLLFTVIPQKVVYVLFSPSFSQSRLGIISCYPIESEVIVSLSISWEN